MKLKIKRGALYLADLNPPFGTEAGKLRPVLVIQNNFFNEEGLASTWILPCTTKLKPENILRVHLPKKSGGNSQDCDVMIDQPRSIDNQRFRKALGMLPTILFDEVVEKLRFFGGL